LDRVSIIAGIGRWRPSSARDEKMAHVEDLVIVDLVIVDLSWDCQ
jgi:hypothetical protein